MPVADYGAAMSRGDAKNPDEPEGTNDAGPQSTVSDLPPTALKRRPGSPTAVKMRSRPRFGDGSPVDFRVGLAPVTTSATDADRTIVGRLHIPGIRTPLAALSLPGSPSFDRTRATQAGRYLVGELIGEGGMGRVVAAEDQSLGRVVAMKSLLPEHGDKEAYVQALASEAAIAARLEHPGIVPVYEVGTLPDGTFYYTMKQVHGNLLHEILEGLKTEKPRFAETYSLTKLLQYFRGICMAVHYAHDSGVIHRDLKPENIVIGSYGEVHVLDWGVARVLPQGDRPGYFAGRPEEFGVVLGTPHYMSPEQARGDTKLVDRRSDVFSLGVILYQMLTHTLPHQHSTTVRQIDALLSEPIIAPRERAPDLHIPVEIERICMKAIAQRREERYATVRDLWGEIEAWMEGERERSRLREMAAKQAEVADAKAASYYARSKALGQLIALMQETAMRARPIDPLPEKRAQWELELKTQEETMIVARLFAEAVLGYQHALAWWPTHRPAIDALVRLYRHRADLARSRNDTAEQIHYSDLARAIAPDPEHARGFLTVRTYPEGAAVRILELSGEPVAEHPEFTSPLVNEPVRPGSYFVSVTMPGYRDRRDPVVIENAEHEQLLINLVPWDSALPLAARGDDLFVMRDAFLTTLATGRLGNLMVLGEAGVGKRKLLDEFGTWLDGLPQLVAYGAVKVEKVHQHIPFHAIGKLFAHRAGIDHRDDAAAVVQKMHDFLRRYQVGPGQVTSAADEIDIISSANILLSLPVFREVVGAASGVGAVGRPVWQDPFADRPDLSGDERSRLMFTAIATVLRRICARTPLVLAIRGADHLDRLTFDLLIHFAYDLYDVPLLCVMFARKDRLNLNCEQELTLNPLESHEVRHQLVMLLRGPVSDATIRFFAAKSAGNAFYVSELARVLLDRGHLVQSGRQWRLSEHYIHDRRDHTIEDILGETLRDLPQAVLATLREASIAGGTFWEAPLKEALGGKLDEVIAFCLEQKLISLRPECRYPGVREYGFRQDWMQRRFYRELEPSRRAAGHAIVGHWLRRVGDGTLSEAALVAGHFDKAGLATEAAELRGRLAAEAGRWERADAPAWFAWPDDPRSGLREDD